jgi:UDP-N-acetylmuramyl pentapeptide synthase
MILRLIADMKTLIRAILVSLLTLEARLVIARHAPKIVAITGSVGKTTTKDAVYAVLSSRVSVARSKKSFNSDIGVPLAILQLENPWSDPFLWIKTLALGLTRLFKPYPEWLVLEVGADRPGDIRTIARWLKPHHVVYTGVPKVPPHVEYFSSAEAVYREKRSLAEHVRPGGKVFVNGDDSRVADMRNQFRSQFVSFGFGPDCDYRADHEEIAFDEAKHPTGLRFRLEHEGSSVPVLLEGTLGRPRILAALAAIAVGDVLGIDAVTASSALEHWEATPGRLRLIAGVNGSIIIDDTYNSSPVAALAALDTLGSIKNRSRKIAMMGDMLELGRESKEAHRTVGERAAKTTSMLITVGFRARAMGEAALDAGMDENKIREYEQGEALRAAKELRLEIKKNDMILIKGSQGMRMEFAVKELMARPDLAPELLVRQEEEWERR